MPRAAQIRLHRADSTAAGWVSTATLGANLAGTDLGAIAANTPLNLTVALKGNYAGAAAMVKSVYTKGSSQYHKFLTPSQFSSMFAASPAAATAVASYLSSFGMGSVTVNPTRTIVTARTTAGTASAAFNTSLHAFNVGGKAIFANVIPASVPLALAGAVAAVGGLNNFQLQRYYHVQKFAAGALPIPFPKTTFASAAAGAAVPQDCNNIGYLGLLVTSYGSSLATYPGTFCYPGFFTPNNFRYTYDDNGAPTGSKTVIADITESCAGTKLGDGCLDDVSHDLWLSEVADGVPETPVTTVAVDSGAQSTDNSGEGEWDIDTQGAAGIAGGVQGMVYYNMSADTLNDLTNAFAKIASDDTVTAANASIGACEFEWYIDGLIQPTDFVLAEAALQGQTITVASGDTGSFCPFPTGENGIPAGVPDIDYPASSPYVLAVGGTSLLANSTTGAYDSEIGWYSSDGGVSLFEPQSPWQSTMIYNNLGQLASAGNRIVPDVVMNADLNTGIVAYVSGATEVIGGTSLAAPLAEGVWARMESMHNNQLGAAEPALYNLYANAGGGLLNQSVAQTLYDVDNMILPPALPTSPITPNGLTPQLLGGFHDIICCANGYYTAAPGFDLTTGMGSLDIGQLAVSLGS